MDNKQIEELAKHLDKIRFALNGISGEARYRAEQITEIMKFFGIPDEPTSYEY